MSDSSTDGHVDMETESSPMEEESTMGGALGVPDSEVFHEFDRVWRELDGAYSAITRYFGLSDSAFEILYTIAIMGEGCTQRDICEKSCLGKQTINSSIRKLERDGMLHLERRGRGREKDIVLTSSGQALLRRCIYPVMRIEAESLEELGRDDLQAFMRACTRFSGLVRRKFGEYTTVVEAAGHAENASENNGMGE